MNGEDASPFGPNSSNFKIELLTVEQNAWFADMINRNIMSVIDLSAQFNISRKSLYKYAVNARIPKGNDVKLLDGSDLCN